MMAILMLTDVNGDQCLVNLNHVLMVAKQENNFKIWIEDGSWIYVKETPEIILSKMKELQIEVK